MRDLLAVDYATVTDVAAGLEQLEAYCLPRRDRRGVFITAYLEITRSLAAELQAGGFTDSLWSARYLVCFGNLYRRALLAYEEGHLEEVPKSWQIAFDAARDQTGLVLQHLILGINAHINHDLALALGEVGIGADRDARYRDHARVNTILEEATGRLKTQVSTLHAPILQRLDWVAGRINDDITNFSIPRARDHAWGFAIAIEGAKSRGERALLLRTLDDQAAVMARLVLSPASRHPVLLRVVRTAERVDGALRRVVGAIGGIR